MKERSEADPFGWVGSVIDGRYRVDAVVGEGGFGVVYAGHHLGFDEAVAIKCLKLGDAIPTIKRDLFLKGFAAEGRILYRLSQRNPNIVRAIDVGAATSPRGVWAPYLVLEWVHGGTLAADIEARARAGLGGRPIVEALSLLEPVARALDTAHGEGIVHRDVKPGNLLLSEVKGGRTVKVLDFGVAKVMSQAAGPGAEATVPGTLIRAFSPSYAPPELFDSKYGSSGPWTDVFALALVFVEIVTGRRALDGDDFTQFYGQTTDPARRPTLRALGFATSDAVERVLQRALAVDPRNRFSRAGEFWDALDAAVRGERAPLRPSVATTFDATAPVRTEVPEHPLTIPGVPPPTMTQVPPVPLTVPMRTGAARSGVAGQAGSGEGPPRRRWRWRLFWVALLGIGVWAMALVARHADLPTSLEEALQRAGVREAPPPRRTAGAIANDGSDPNHPVVPDDDHGLVDHSGREWGNRCFDHWKQGKLGWAKAECEMGMAMEPTTLTRAQLIFNEGLIAKTAGDTDAAILDFTESLRLRKDPDVQRALDQLDPPAARSPSPRVAAPSPVGAQHPEPATPHEVSIMDPKNEPKATVAARVGDPVAVTLPMYPTQGRWTYRSVDGAIGPAREEDVPRWLGPSTPGDKFTFATSGVAAGDHMIYFKSQPTPVAPVNGYQVSPEPATLALVTIHLTN